MSNTMKWLSRLYLTFIYLVLFAPILVMVVFSFNASKVGYTWGGFSLDWYYELFNNEAMIQAAINSVLLAVVAATVTTVIGSLTALSFQRYNFKGKSVLQSLLFVLMMSPEIVLAISLLALFLMIGIELGFVTLLLAHITFCLPFVVITVSARLASLDNSILEAARDLGASFGTIFRRIILPLSMPGVMVGSIFVSVMVLGEFATAASLSGRKTNMLGNIIVSQVGSLKWAFAAVAGVVLTLIIAAVITLALRIVDLRKEM